MNPRNILEQLLGSSAAADAGDTLRGARDRLAGSGLGGVAGGVAAGGLIGLLLGNKKARKTVGKIAGGAVTYGAAAALGALAYRAWQNWQAGQAPAGTVSGASATMPSTPPADDTRFLPAPSSGTDGRPFELAVVKAMIAAANADGHIGPDEQRTIFDRVGRMALDAEDKAFVFDALGKPPSLQDIAALANGPEQAAELWLASRVAIDPDHPAEQAYLEALASRLGLAPELVAHLEAQVAAAEGGAPVAD